MKKEKQQFEIIYFELDSGECPVSEFIDLLEPKMKAKVFMEMALLEEPGNSLRFPYSEYLSEGIFELRVLSGTDITGNSRKAPGFSHGDIRRFFFEALSF